MRRAVVSLLVLLMLAGALHAAFRLESAEITVSGIQKDGSAKVHESIKVIADGNFSRAAYDSGYTNNNTLAYWSAITGLRDVKLHVNTAKVTIHDLRVQPQPQTSCNSFMNLCHGELKLDYTASPIYNYTVGLKPRVVNGTGLFSVDEYKPRTRRYSVNPESLSFSTTEQGGVVLDSEVYLTVSLPEDSIIASEADVNPMPQGVSESMPGHVPKLTWNDMVLAKFALSFEVEEGLDKEVTDFFSGALADFQALVESPHGLSLIALVVILVASYIYVNVAKKKREE